MVFAIEGRERSLRDSRNEIILLAKKAADAWRSTDTYHQAAQIIDMLISELEGDPALTPPNEPLKLEDAKKERYIWFTPLNDWGKVTPFGVLFFGSEELMTWETLCEEWGYRFKAYCRPPEGEEET